MKDLSVIIVSYNVRDFLKCSLESVRKATRNLDLEVFVVDNDSKDDSVEMVRTHFPDVHLMDTGENLGFAKANNLALKEADGRYLMILNPDCVLPEDSLETLVQFMDDHPDVGAAGPKLLNRDGSFQVASKRGFPTPWASFCKLSGLSTLFPRSRVFNQYELGWLDPDETHEIDVLCGAAMIVRREAYEKVGGLSEEYFMFGEDIDWSYTIQSAGWKIYYVAETSIIHYKGESTRRSNTDREYHFYNAMRIFAKKHFRSGLVNRIAIELGIFLGEIVARLRRHSYLWMPSVVDFSLLAALFVSAFYLYFRDGMQSGMWIVSFIYPPLTILMLTLTGAYQVGKLRFVRILSGILLGFALVSTLAYFIKSIQFSRLVIASTGIVSPFLLYGWRKLVSKLSEQAGKRKIILVGMDDLSKAVVEKVRSGELESVEIVGWLVYNPEHLGTSCMDLPVLGLAHHFADVVEEAAVTEALFSSRSATYEDIFKLISKHPVKNVSIQIIPDGFDRGDQDSLLELNFGSGILTSLVSSQKKTMVMRKS